MKLGNHRVWIGVDKAPRQEYTEEVSEDGKSATCWLASETAKPFCIEHRHTFEADADSIYACYVALDSISVGGNIVSKETNSLEGEHSSTLRDVLVSSTSTRSFTFANMETTDDETMLDAGISPCIGEIKAEIWTVKRVRREHAKATTLPAQEKVHERTKKGLLSHAVHFGDAEVSDKPYSVTIVQRLEKCFTFIFKYRPLEVLQANDIAPRPPQTGEKRGAEEVVQNDSISTARPSKMRARNTGDFGAEPLPAKGQLSGMRERRKGKGVKMEAPDHSEFAPGEIIDLTFD